MKGALMKETLRTDKDRRRNHKGKKRHEKRDLFDGEGEGGWRSKDETGRKSKGEGGLETETGETKAQREAEGDTRAIEASCETLSSSARGCDGSPAERRDT